MINRNEWVPADNFFLEQKASYSVKSMENLLVIAGPGTGKTEMLAQRANYLFETGICKEPYNILAISFKKDSASNLGERVKKRSSKSGDYRFDSMTYDALAKRVLDQFRNGLNITIRPDGDYLVQNETKLSEMVKEASQSYLLNSYCVNKTWREFSFLNPTINNVQKKLGNLMLHGTDKLQANLSYHGIMQLAIKIIETNPSIRYAFQVAYPFVFLDEFQDTTDLQYKFIKTLFLSSPVVITAVGDDKQRIMDFAGARKTIFLDFKNDFSADELHLSVNHRSAPQIINLQLSMYKSLQEDYNEVFYSGKWNKNEGEISLIQSLDDYEEAKKVAQDIMEKIHQGIKPNEIVILVKQRAEDYAPLIIDALKEKGIKARIESDYQSLIKEPLVKIILHSIMLSSTTSYTEDWQKYLSLYMESQGISDVEDERIIYDAEKALNEFLKSTSLMLNNKTTVKKLVQCIIDFWTVDFFQTTFPEYLHGSNLEETITSFINLMELEYQSGESWTEAVKSFVGDNSIPIMTIHKSKGLEFKAVYLIALDDNAFWSFKCNPDATRRALFVAISRAKQYLTFTFSESRFTTKHPGRQTHVLISEFYELIKRFVN